MSSYEGIIDMMRTQGMENLQNEICLAVMTGPDSCKIGELPLFKEDLYIASHLMNPAAVKVSISEEHSDRSTYLPALKEGDLVALCRINDTKYAVLERLVDV